MPWPSRLALGQADACERRVGEHHMRNEPIIRPAVITGHVVADDPEVVDRNMRELRAASAFANRPDARGSGLQPIVDLDKAARASAIPASSRPIFVVFAIRPTATSR